MTSSRQTRLQEIDLANIAAQIEVGTDHLRLHRLLQAEVCYRRVIYLVPGIPEAHNNLGTVLKELGQIDAAQASFEQALKLRPNYTSAHSNLLFTMHYKTGQTLAGLRQAHEAWAHTQLGDLPSSDRLPVRSKASDEPIVVGLVSPDLYYHPVGVFLLPWLEQHDQPVSG